MAAPSQVGSLVTFTSGTTIVSADVNSNFSDIRTQFNRLINAAGGMYIGDDANANQTLGLTINQGAATNEILTFQQSSVNHLLVTYTETDTYGYFQQYATTGGLSMRAVKAFDATDSTLELIAFGGAGQNTKATTTKGLIDLVAIAHNGADAIGNVGADVAIVSMRARVGGSNLARWLLDEDGDTWQTGGAVLGGSAVDANVTLGLVINQGANDDRILTLKASDVAHALVSQSAETDTFFDVRKLSTGAVEGGAWLRAIKEDGASTGCFQVSALGGLADTAKTTSAGAQILMYAAEHDGANALTSIAANGNVFGVQCLSGSNQTKFLVDEDGDFHYDGADGGAFDDYDDAVLVRAFALATSKDTIRSEFDDFVGYNEDDLVAAGILGAPVAEGGLVNGAQLQRLLVGAAWQNATRVMELEAQVEGLVNQVKLLT